MTLPELILRITHVLECSRPERLRVERSEQVVRKDEFEGEAGRRLGEVRTRRALCVCF